jgi:hypothetical protein
MTLMTHFIIGELNKDDRTVIDMKMIPAESSQEAIITYGDLPGVTKRHPDFKRGEYIVLGETEFRDGFPTLVMHEDAFLNITEQVTRSFEVKLPSDSNTSESEPTASDNKLDIKEETKECDAIAKEIHERFVKSAESNASEDENPSGDTGKSIFDKFMTEIDKKVLASELWMIGLIDDEGNANPFFEGSCMIIEAKDAAESVHFYDTMHGIEICETPVSMAIPCITGMNRDKLENSNYNCYDFYIMSVMDLTEHAFVHHAVVLLAKTPFSTIPAHGSKEIAKTLYLEWLRKTNRLNKLNVLQFIVCYMVQDYMWANPHAGIIQFDK